MTDVISTVEEHQREIKRLSINLGHSHEITYFT